MVLQALQAHILPETIAPRIAIAVLLAVVSALSSNFSPLAFVSKSTCAIIPAVLEASRPHLHGCCHPDCACMDVVVPIAHAHRDIDHRVASKQRVYFYHLLATQRCPRNA
jgi:hypothetical protein